VFLLYAVKVALYVGGWLLFCGFSPALGGVSSVASWWLHPVAFQKAIVWSMLFEVLGLGCGSGPLTGRYFPPFGGFLYFLRPKTTKLPLFPRLPLLGGSTRGVVDVLLYLALLIAAVRALVAPAPSVGHFVTLAALVAVLGVRRQDDLPRGALGALLGHHHLLRLRRQLDCGREGRAARPVVLGRLLQAQSPFPDGRLRHDEQRAVHSVCVVTPKHVPRLSAGPPPFAAGDDHGACRDGARVRRPPRVPPDSSWRAGPSPPLS